MAYRRSLSIMHCSLIWVLMSCYWFGTFLNILRYLVGIGSGNYDCYLGYLCRQVVWNFPVRLMDELFHFSGLLLPSCFENLSMDVAPFPPAVVYVMAEIALVDFFLGSAFWLLFLLLALYFDWPGVVWKVIKKAVPAKD